VRRAAAAPRLQTRYSLDGISNYSSEMVLCARNTQDSSRVSKVPKVKSYNLFTGYFYFINFIVGTGILNLPYVFYNSGIIAATLTLLFISMINCCTVMWIMESQSRAQVHACGWLCPVYLL
jgi:hypothetical protein